MPYANIHWIKLKLELLNDKRFLFDIDDSQKLLFIGLLLLAGATKNTIPDDENFLKNRLNLLENNEKIRKNLQKIFEVFPKTVSKNGFIKFKNFNELHHSLRNADGTPKDCQWDAKGLLDKSRVDKSRVDKIMMAFLDFKNYPKDREDLNYYYRRFTNTIKHLLVLAKGNADDVIEAIRWVGEHCDKKGLTWTLETALKWYPEFAVKGAKSDALKRLEKLLEEKDGR